MRKLLVISLLAVVCTTFSLAQIAATANHLVPNGKGWGVAATTGTAPAVSPNALTLCKTGNGINYHTGGTVLGGTVNVYLIWYGNWTNGPKPSDSATTITLINNMLAGESGSGYGLINSTYCDTTKSVTGTFKVAGSTSPGYSHGTSFGDTTLKTIVTDAFTTGGLPKDSNAVYFVLTSSDVNETSGFCTAYCGFHTQASISGTDIKYSFVGNTDRCLSTCSTQNLTISPNNDTGGDAMASVISHELEEANSDPDLNAWFDRSGQENADKCAYKYGPLSTASNGSKYNETLGGLNFLIQMNWENARKGGCDQVKGGPFYKN